MTRKEKSDGRPITFYAMTDLFDQIDEWAEKAHMTRSAFCSLAVQIGGRGLMRMLAPEDFLTPEMMKTALEAGLIPEVELEKEAEKAVK